MKAPDKIYVREFAGGLNQMWSSIIATETSAIAQHEYIRKDALLELINKKLQESADRLDYSTNKAYAEMLDKLNEM